MSLFHRRTAFRPRRGVCQISIALAVASAVTCIANDDYLAYSSTSIHRTIISHQESSESVVPDTSTLRIQSDAGYESIDAGTFEAAFPRLEQADGGGIVVLPSEFVGTEFTMTGSGTEIDARFPFGTYHLVYFEDGPACVETTEFVFPRFASPDSHSVKFVHQRWDDGRIVLPIEMPFLRFTPGGTLRIYGDIEESTRIEIETADGQRVGDVQWSEITGFFEPFEHTLDFGDNHALDLSSVIQEPGPYVARLHTTLSQVIIVGNADVSLVSEYVTVVPLQIISDPSVLEVPDVEIGFDDETREVVLRWPENDSQAYALSYQGIPDLIDQRPPYLREVIVGSPAEAGRLEHRIRPGASGVPPDAILRLRPIPR